MNVAALSNDREAGRQELAAVHGSRHRIEEVLKEGKQEVGLGQYEVRSWTGWHHHMTLSLLALWFLQLERGEVGKKNVGDHGGASASAAEQAAGEEAGKRGGDQPRDQSRAAA